MDRHIGYRSSDNGVDYQLSASTRPGNADRAIWYKHNARSCHAVDQRDAKVTAFG